MPQPGQPTIWMKIAARIARIGVNPNDSDELRLQKNLAKMVTVGLIVNIPGAIALGMLMRFYGDTVGGELFFIFAAINALLIASIVATRRFTYVLTLGFWLGLTIAFLISVILGPSLGFVGMLWGFMVPMLYLVIDEQGPTLQRFAVYLVVLMAFVLLEMWWPAPSKLPEAFTRIASVVSLFAVTTATFFIFRYFLRQKNHFQQMADDLLLNILPRDIATILKKENRVIADYFEQATILFADLVGFTPLSAHMAPQESVSLLNEVFSYFDELVERYGVEKIKTIGDCYMVAAGVPRFRPDHALVLVRMALDIRAYVAQREFNGRRLVFRIGLNSGPLVAGIIGRKKFSYDLWGDAVNTASRMESAGSGGMIQITEATYELVKEHFMCEPRGVIAVKGKGDMPVWWVSGERP